RGIFGRDRRPRHRRAIRAVPSPLGAERDKNLDQASRWACDSLLSRLACFSMSWLGFHCASMLRLTTQPRSNHLRAAPVFSSSQPPCGIGTSDGVLCGWEHCSSTARGPAAAYRAMIGSCARSVLVCHWIAAQENSIGARDVRETSKKCSRPILKSPDTAAETAERRPVERGKK